MTSFRVESYARAGLVGNPSDGYFGKTISIIVKNFCARIELTESKQLRIVPNERDHCEFSNVDALLDDIREYGYVGGLPLLKGTVKVFRNWCRQRGIALPAGRNFTMRYHSNVPVRVGMAGSSAIVTAAMRALAQFYEVEIPRPIQPNLVLSVERDELNIPAGLQDRVIQTYEGCVFMDFDRQIMEKQGHGNYEPISPHLLPPVYLAFTTSLSEGTQVFHNDIRGRWLAGEKLVTDAMHRWADLAREARDLIVAGRGREIAPLMNANFDLRRTIYKLSEGNIAMVEAARSTGASAKFTGSGGAIVGTYEDEAMFTRLTAVLGAMGLQVVKPQIV